MKVARGTVAHPTRRHVDLHFANLLLHISDGKSQVLGFIAHSSFANLRCFAACEHMKVAICECHSSNMRARISVAELAPSHGKKGELAGIVYKK